MGQRQTANPKPPHPTQTCWRDAVAGKIFEPHHAHFLDEFQHLVDFGK
jgi:hypothetical protein